MASVGADERTCRLPSGALSLARRPGHGPPIVLLHGVVRRRQCFSPLLPALAEAGEAWCVDMPGHGASGRLSAGYRVVDYGERIVELLEQQLGEPAVLLGHSLGAMVAADVAHRVPTKVRALVLIDPPFDTMGSRIAATTYPAMFRGFLPFAGSDRSPWEIAHRLAEIPLSGPDGPYRLGAVRDATSLLFTAKSLIALDPAVLPPVIEGRWLDGYDLEAILGSIACPTLLVQGDPAAGGTLADALAERIRAAIPSVIRVRLDGADHMIHWNRTGELLGHVLRFLTSL